MVRDPRAARARELRVRLSKEKWDWLERWVKLGVTRTYSDIVLLALDCFAEKQLQRELQQARLLQLKNEDTTQSQ